VGSFLTTPFRFSSITVDLIERENAEERHVESPGFAKIQAQACNRGKEGETFHNELY
jgi:hypothetical protein